MDKWGYSYLIDQKTLWEKEKLLVTSNFFFAHNVFKSCQLLMHQNEYLWSKGLRRGVVLEQFYVRAVDCLIQVVSNTGLTVFAILLKFWVKQLTHSHPMTPFDGSGKEAFCKHCG